MDDYRAFRLDRNQSRRRGFCQGVLALLETQSGADVPRSPSQASSLFTRRQCVQAGALTMLGLNSFTLQHLRAASSEKSSPADKHRKNSCVFIFLFGGPSHIDLWD